MDQMKQGQLLKEVLPSSGLKYNSGHWRRFRTTARNCFYLEPGLISPSMQQQWPNDLISSQHSRRLDLPISLFSNCVSVSFSQLSVFNLSMSTETWKSLSWSFILVLQPYSILQPYAALFSSLIQQPYSAALFSSLIQQPYSAALFRERNSTHLPNILLYI